MSGRSNLLHLSLALGTWLIIFIISISFLWDERALYLAVTLQCLIGLCLWVSAASNLNALLSKWQPITLWLMLGLIFTLGWNFALGIFLIYSIIWIAVAVHHLSLRTCWLMLGAICIVWYLIRVYSWQDTNAFTDTILVGTFHAFGLVSSLSARASAQANERTQELNRELLATQHLLGEVSKETERTRIARDLHDLLGHHLTALTINLQVAARLTEGEAQDKVEQCHSLAKLLLSDVREAVSTLRETPILTLSELLELAIKDVPKLDIKLDIEQDHNLDDVNLAEVLLRSVQEAITNTLRHSDATAMLISTSLAKDALNLIINDNGGGKHEAVAGNGLNGMRERVERLKGQIEFSNDKGFQIAINIPISSTA